MENTFIKSIRVGKLRHLENILIEISDTQRKHLILTGKNGSGKTSLLEAMNAIIIPTYGNFLNNQNASTDKYQHVEIIFEQPMLNISNLKMLYISTMSGKFELPKALEENHEKWFDNLLEALQSIYDCQDLRLYKDNKNFTFMIEKPGQKPLSLHEMSGGYSSFINIYMELLAQLGSTDVVIDCGKSAIAMIDGVETHLHIEMQKKVLPFLANKFPNVQFIVTTHSSFVMTSLENAIVYDLGKNERLENPSFYSYDTVVKSFMDTSMYSDELQGYFAHYKELCFKDRTPEENGEFLKVKAELEIRAIPSTELYIAFQELEKARKVSIIELL